MEYLKDDLKWDRKAKVSLKIIVVGAGMAGLSVAIGLKQCGHDVLVLEQVKEIAEIGAGVYLAPNSSRCLARLGVLEEVLKYTTVLEKNSLRRWKDDEELGITPLFPTVAETYNAPLGVIHRGDLQRVLLRAAKAAKVEIQTSSQVSRADDQFEPRVQLNSGEWIEGDLVIAADGIKSGLRKQISASYDHVDRVTPTGDAAYRLLIPKENMQGDERALDLISSKTAMRWMGPHAHIMAYPIKNGMLYNMALLHPQMSPSESDESWLRKGDKNEMMELFKDWNSTVKKLMSYVPEGEVIDWTLNTHMPLPAWHENKVVLIGDACHPMLPYVAQGLAQATEDAGVLSAAFSLIESKEEIGIALEIYESIRKDRGEAIQNSAERNKASLHLPDGPEQEARDQRIRDTTQGKGSSPDLLADRDWQDFMWGVDVMKDVIYNWEDLKTQVQAKHTKEER